MLDDKIKKLRTTEAWKLIQEVLPGFKQDLERWFKQMGPQDLRVYRTTDEGQYGRPSNASMDFVMLTHAIVDRMMKIVILATGFSVKRLRQMSGIWTRGPNQPNPRSLFVPFLEDDRKGTSV